MYARISIYYTGTNILYAERRCPMCNFDASVPVSRDPPCYSLYPFPGIGTGENEREADGRKRQREGWNEGTGEEGSLDTRKSKKRERNRPGTTRALQRLFLSAWGGGRDTIKSILPIGLSIP